MHRWQEREARNARAKLVEQFPLVFFPKGALKRPLKIGIMVDLFGRAKRMSPAEIRWAVADYCAGPSYRVGFIVGAIRVDLDGQAAGVVTEEEAAHAQQQMERFKEETRSRWRAAFASSSSQTERASA